MRIPLTLQQLESFVEVARAESFRAAAEILHVSQPALSRTIRMAEQALDTKLFDRDTRHVALTAAGQELFPIARRLLDNFHGGFSELSEFLQGRTGIVKIAALPSAGVALLPQAIASFRRIHPSARFSLIEGPADVVRAALEDGRADFGITVRPGAHEGLVYQHCLDDLFVALCRSDHALARQSSVSWSALTTHPFITSGGTSSIRPLVEALFLQKGLNVQSTFEFPSIAAAGAMVKAGLGVTALPQLALQLIALEGLVTRPLSGPRLSRPIGVVTKAGRSLAPITLAFIDAFLKAHQ
jgi:LysR family carnitine catabolism transcriptional activator